MGIMLITLSTDVQKRDFCRKIFFYFVFTAKIFEFDK